MDEKINWFDYFEIDTWSLMWLDDVKEQLGYSTQADIKVYWLLPEKQLDNGLRIVSTNADTLAMASVAHKRKNLKIYLDHEDQLLDRHWDDIVMNPIAELPKVISPVKQNRERREKLPEFYSGLKTSKEDVECVTSSEDGTEESDDSDFCDSENELEDGDDDLFVDEEAVNEKKTARSRKAKGSRHKMEGRTEIEASSDEEDTDEEDLQLPADEVHGPVCSFKRFRQEDMSSPAFKIGMIFESVEVVRKALTEYSLKNRVAIKLPINDRRRVSAHCAQGCPWDFYASFDSRAKAFMVKRYCGKHNCQKQWMLKKCTSVWLAEKYLDSFRSDDKMSLANFSRTVQREWNISPSRSKLARARRIAMKKIYGDESLQYNKLWNFAHEIRRSNPGSSFFLNLVGSHFSNCYMSLDACKRGFMSGCRPIIFLDGCHIKTKFGGVILTAVGIDPNDCIYPISLAVVEVESLATWKWFLQTLKEELGIEKTYPWTLMTDKQKGLIPAVQEVFPKAEHRFCVRHLYSNFRDAGFRGEILKNQLWTCARSSTVSKWNYQMEKMKGLSQGAYEWLEKMAPNTWVRAFFSEFPKSDVLLNNNCEVFNNYILEARELPILSMLEKIKNQLMTRYYSKQKEFTEQFVGTICPKIRKKLTKISELANVCYVLPSGNEIFQVNDRDFQYTVDLQAKTCECRKWNLTGIPCQHAISCLRHERIPPESVVHDCYSLAAFNRAYETNIMPCKDISIWEDVGGQQVLPPIYEKKVGRPPKNRRKQPHEVQGKNGPRMSRHGITITCSYCKGENHNVRGCLLKKNGIRPEDYDIAEVTLPNNSIIYHLE